MDGKYLDDKTRVLIVGSVLIGTLMVLKIIPFIALGLLSGLLTYLILPSGKKGTSISWIFAFYFLIGMITLALIGLPGGSYDLILSEYKSFFGFLASKYVGFFNNLIVFSKFKIEEVDLEDIRSMIWLSYTLSAVSCISVAVKEDSPMKRFKTKNMGDTPFFEEHFPPKDSFRIGKKIKGYKGTVRVTEDQINHHIHILGASGYGKSVLLMKFVRNRIETGKGMLFCDLKGDLNTIKEIKSISKKAGREGDLFILSTNHPEISSTYNVIERSTATQMRDRIISSLNWSEEFYKNEVSSYLLKLCIGLVWLREHIGLTVHLGTILKCTTDKSYIEDLINEIPSSELEVRNYIEQSYRYATDKDKFKNLSGLVSQLESILLTDFGNLLTPDEKSKINLFDAARNSKLIVVMLDTRNFSESAKNLGKLILQDLKAASSEIDAKIEKDDRKPFTVLIDEFSDLAQSEFLGFLDRARSSKMGVVVCHQELSDLKKLEDGFADRLMHLTSTTFCFLNKTPETAEKLALHAGTETVSRITEQINRNQFFGDTLKSNAAKRDSEVFNMHPNEYKKLRVGECICIQKHPHAQTYIVKVNKSGP